MDDVGRGPELRTPAGRCVLLTDGGWCGLQQRAGEAALPYGCATFPRTPRAWPDGVEITATAACPEVARLVLADDDMLGWGAVGPDAVPRGLVEVSSVAPELLGAARRVQAGLVALVANPRWTLRERLLQAILAVVPIDGEAPATFRDVVARAATLSPDWAAEAAGWRDRLTVPLEPALAWVDGVARTRLGQQEGFLDGILPPVSEGGLAALHARVRARRDAAGAALDPLFARHVRYLLLHHPPTEAPDPVAWLQDVLHHAAAVRALALAHPQAPVGPDAPAWAATVTDVAWRYARELEHALRSHDPAAPWVHPAALRTPGALALLVTI